MNALTADTLIRLTNRFYRQQASSFSATRKNPWPGWERLADFLESHAGALLAGADSPSGSSTCDSERPASLLDLGCGNLRFERFLRRRFPHTDIDVYAVDNCPLLMKGGESEDWMPHFQELDIASVLSGGEEALAERLEAPVCDLAVCFGVMHHIPGFDRRRALIRGLVSQTRSGGLVAISFWRFMSSDVLAEKARALQAHALADVGLSSEDLDRGDYLLGWQGRQGAYRYCHHFEAAEIQALVDEVSDAAFPVDRYCADGRTGSLNAYVVLRVR
jgi:tRNA (uracil-5-)-methyltransferase TRM9